MMLVLSIVHSQIVSTITISKKNFMKSPRSHSPRCAKRGQSTSSKIKSKFTILFKKLSLMNLIMSFDY